ncbi:MAG: hypothetical protein ACRDXX_10165 [Stackebrandtia sp.]
MTELDPSVPGAYDLELIRAVYPRAYRRWSRGEDDLLAQLWRYGLDVGELSAVLGRNPGGVASRLVKVCAHAPPDAANLYFRDGRTDPLGGDPA